MRRLLTLIVLCALSLTASAQKRLVIVDQDGSGPGGSNQMAMLVLLQAPQRNIAASLEENRA